MQSSSYNIFYGNESSLKTSIFSALEFITSDETFFISVFDNFYSKGFKKIRFYYDTSFMKSLLNKHKLKGSF